MHDRTDSAARTGLVVVETPFPAEPPAGPKPIMLLALTISVLPHWFHLHWSLVSLFLVLLGWRWMGYRWPGMLPGKRALLPMTVGSISLVLISRHGAIDMTTSTGLLVTALGLKLMELKSRRDLLIALFLGWFVTLTQFLYDQSLMMGGYALLSASLLTAALVQIDPPGSLSWTDGVRIVSALLGPALPLTILLFLFFPRVTGPFFALPVDTRATTGLSDVLEPGAISRLSTSPEIAFRVDFDGRIPPPRFRYWRAQVFENFDGRRWRPSSPESSSSAQTLPLGRGTAYRYRVTVEPHHHHWLFSLGYPGSSISGVKLTRKGVLQSERPVDERITYSLESYPAYRFHPLEPEEKQKALQLPASVSRPVEQLVTQWQQESGDLQGLANAILAYFRTQGFVYTLNPPLLADHPMERFLFESRKGFCEHYASAFVYLMRVGGVPARIVGGYLGGFLNPKGRFLEVYQANAHAWAEIWIDGQGWVRYDPTRAVARIYLDNLLEPQEPGISPGIVDSLMSGVTNDSSRLLFQPSWWHRMMRGSRILWSDLDHRWHLWVLNYDRDYQLSVIAWVREHAGALLLICGLSGVAWWVGRRQSMPDDPLQKEYQRFLERLRKKKNLVKLPCETALEFSRRAAAIHPEKEKEIYQITRFYVQARYGKLDGKTAKRFMKSLNINI